MASAHPNIGVSTDVSHVILSPGETTNITLTVDNDGESIESYEINVSGYDSVWEVIPTSTTLSGVIPTTSSSTTIAVRLATNALPSNSGSMTITVTEPDANISSSITVLLSFKQYTLPSIDSSTAGDNGLVEMDPGQEVNVSIMVQNSGNVNDTILLSIDQSPDLIGFWANWTSGGNGNKAQEATTLAVTVQVATIPEAIPRPVTALVATILEAIPRPVTALVATIRGAIQQR